MASRPGPLTEWPWQKLGNFKVCANILTFIIWLKYVILAPWAAHSIYSYVKGDKDLGYLAVFPLILWRIIHFLIWKSFSRFQTARNINKIVQRGIEFEQVDREENWDDQVILNGILCYLTIHFLEKAHHLPLWRADGLILAFLLHMGPVEFLYYWLHRALHHHYLYSRYHSHHHLSIVTEPHTAVIHPFIEVVSYALLFSIPQLVVILTGTASITTPFVYMTYIDFMNSLGHCNFELVPTWLFRIFPPLKYLMYTPSFHSLHHTHFRTNYSLFMPLYDYLYGTMDDSSDALYETSFKGQNQGLDVVHLTHPTTLDSIYHLPLGWATFASKPYSSSWYLWVMTPFSLLAMLVTWILGSTFTVESNRLDKLQIQTWAIPRFSFHYRVRWQKASINSMIDKAILDANEKGVKVISLGLLNQKEQLNGHGELFVQRNPNLKVRVVDGTALAVGVVLNSIPEGAKEVVLRGHLSKAGRALVLALCLRRVKVLILRADEFKWLKLQLPTTLGSQLVLSSNSITVKVWLVGEGLTKEEQRRAPKGACFIPFSQFPPVKTRKDCIYYTTPALMAPKAFENMHACENWLPRRAMSAWRAAGIVHALEGWDTHECGDKVLDVAQVWATASRYGFLPLPRI